MRESATVLISAAPSAASVLLAVAMAAARPGALTSTTARIIGALSAHTATTAFASRGVAPNTTAQMRAVEAATFAVKRAGPQTKLRLNPRPAARRSLRLRASRHQSHPLCHQRSRLQRSSASSGAAQGTAPAKMTLDVQHAPFARPPRASHPAHNQLP